MQEFPENFDERVSSRCRALPESDRLFFIHVPKTAGTAVKWRLEKLGMETYHMADPHPFCFLSVDSVTTPVAGRIDRYDINLQIQQTYPMYPERWSKMLKFSLTRNPFSWLVSWYLHGTPETEDGWGNVNYIYGVRSFPEFVEKFCSPKILWNHALNTKHWKKCMYTQWFDKDGQSVVDFAVRSESLNAGIDKLLQAAGYSDFEAPPRDKENRSHRKNKPYQEYYDSASREIAERYFSRECQIFGYDFDGPTDQRVIYDVQSMGLAYNMHNDLFRYRGMLLNRG